MDDHYYISPVDYEDDPTLCLTAAEENDLDLLDFSDIERPEGWTEEAFQEALQSLAPQEPKDIAEHSLIYFVYHYLSAYLTSEFADAHYELAEVVESPKPRKRILVLFPREHAKTTIFNVAYVLWCICYRKKRNIGLISDKKTQAQEFLRSIKTELENNHLIRQDFGDLVGTHHPEGEEHKGKWDETHIITSNGVQVRIGSPDSQVRGMQFNAPVEIIDPLTGTKRIAYRPLRPDLLIFDDVLNDKLVRNLKIRNELEKWFFAAAINALDSEVGDILVIGTLLHFDDLLSRLYKEGNLQTQDWVKIKRPACKLTANGPINVLWPSRWPAEKLKRRQREIGSIAFAREFLLDPRDEEAKLFDSEWFKYYVDPTLPEETAGALLQQGYLPLPNDLICVTAVDPNAKDKTINDYTVVSTVGYSPSTRNYYVLEAWQDRPTPQRRIEEMLNQYAKYARDVGGKYRHVGWVVETYGSQWSITHYLREGARKRGYNARIEVREEAGIDKVERAAPMSPIAEQGRIILPMSVRYDDLSHTTVWHRPMQWLVDELDQFPFSGHDDGVDSLQRAFSRLIREERKYIVDGRYGKEAQEGFEAYVRTFGGTLRQYLGDVHGM